VVQIAIILSRGLAFTLNDHQAATCVVRTLTKKKIQEKGGKSEIANRMTTE
jgi:hypothetical protein